MKVLLTRPFFSEDLAYIKSRLDKNIQLIIPPSYSEDVLIKYAGEANVFLGGFISRSLIDTASALSFIQIPWTGVDSLDFKLLSEMEVTVCNSHSNATIVAEHAVALMMDAAKKLSYHDHLLRLGKWNRVNKKKPNVISPFSARICRASVGIVGFGAIGKKIHKLLSGYDCKFTVITKDISNKSDYPGVTILPESQLYEGLNSLKFVFVSVPLTPETKGLINNKFISSLNEGAILINISRGEVMNEENLYNALLNNELAFAAIDTWFNYPTRENPEVFPSDLFEYHKLPNVIMSPHRAGYVEGGFPHLDDAIENLNRYNTGLPLINIVNLNEKY